LWKATISFVKFVRLSVRPHGTIRLTMAVYHGICHWSIFRKSVEKIQV